MDETTRVNLHCHSLFSPDGELTPEALADHLSNAGVRYAALTDHDTVHGLPRFQEAAKRCGIGFIPGMELTARCDGREIHLLAYGFDASHPELNATLASLRQAREFDVQSIAGSLRRKGTLAAHETNGATVVSAAPDGSIEIGDAIALIQRAGGLVFLAHPLVFEPEIAVLDILIANLKTKGLNGLEAIYEPFSAAQRAELVALARRHQLQICAGTDVHSADRADPAAYGIAMPTTIWKQFRQAVFSGATFTDDALLDQKPTDTTAAKRPLSRWQVFRQRTFAVRILFPALLAILLFVVTIWVMILPAFQRILFQRKKELIRELTNSAWSILASYERDERAGIFTRQNAQNLAKSRIEVLRYGKEGKDYFWLQDLRPYMLMHPYRPDLNGQDVSTFTDSRGVRIFVEFAELVRRQGDGYIDYVWQWKDDPRHLAPKESYIKGFEPWGWIIGTGIYIDDVHHEIARIERNLMLASLVISGMVVGLVAFVVQQSLRIEQDRRHVEESLRESNERYRSLVEATTEGTLLVLDGRCRYANRTFLQIVGYNVRQIELFDLADVLPRNTENADAWEHINQFAAESGGSVGFEGVLQRADGRRVECVLVLNPIAMASDTGFILLAKEVRPRVAGDVPGSGLAQVAQATVVGMFRAKAVRRGLLIEMNPAARTLIQRARLSDDPQISLADLFPEAAEYDEFVALLQQQGVVADRLLAVGTVDAGTCMLSLSATLTRDERGAPVYIDGVLTDHTDAHKYGTEREALIEKLQTSLLFLHEPIGTLNYQFVTCDLHTPVGRLAALMTERNASAALIHTETGVEIGIITDRDLRSRVLARGLDPHTPVHAVMSAPLAAVSEHTRIYEALLRMEEKGIQHLVVKADNGQIIGVVHNKDLIQFHRYGATVLTREIARAATPEAAAQQCQRTPELVTALVDCNARPHNITHMVSAICDAAVERFIALALDELGPPPADFVFIAMGSHGRQEQTLLTDQDNALIFAAPDDSSHQVKAQEYFLQLGAKVCAWLAMSGYPVCRGQVMANNPRWCQSLPDWKHSFVQWIRTAEPQQLLEFNIFFDFRPVCGATELAYELRQSIHAALHEYPAFFPYLARSALNFTPPFRLLGNIYLSGGSAEHSGQLNLKDALMPIVSFARLYALRQQIDHASTIGRIEALSEHNILLPASRDDILAAYNFLMRLRLQQQSAAIRAGQPPENFFHPRKIGHIEQELLKQAFVQIAAVQKKIQYDFLGGV